MHFNTLIIGASFSGLVAALKASEAGSVGIVDKRVKPGAPVNTTGAIPIDWLKKMDLLPPKECIATETYGMEIISPNGESIAFTKPTPDGYVLYPDLFTRWLVGKALDKGAKIFSGTQATEPLMGKNNGESGKLIGVKTAKGDFKGDYVVGADGHGSNVGKWVGLTRPLDPPDCHSGVEYLVENDGSQDAKVFKLWFGNKVAPGGYAWSFPEGEDKLRVGVGIPISVGVPPKKYLDDFRESHKEFGGKILRREGGAIPTAKPLRTAVLGNVMVVGDAGRFCSSLHGGGIWFGMWSGRLAGEAIVAKDPLLYDRLWKKALYGVLSRHYKLKRWFYAMSDSDLNRLVAVFKTYQTDMSNPDAEFSTAILHALAKDPLFLMKTAGGWVKVGLLSDAVHRIVPSKFRIA